MTPRAKAIRARFFARVECLKLGHLLSPFALESEGEASESWRAECLRCKCECLIFASALDSTVTLSGGWQQRCADSKRLPLTNQTEGGMLSSEKGA